jgi:hypothetical protein
VSSVFSLAFVLDNLMAIPCLGLWIWILLIILVRLFRDNFEFDSFLSDVKSLLCCTRTQYVNVNMLVLLITCSTS